MSPKENEGNFLLKGMYASPVRDKPEMFYKKHVYYTHLYLKKGIELWNSNIIKTNIIPLFELNRIDLYYLNKNFEDMTKEETKLACQNHELLLRFYSYFVANNIDLDIPNLLMAIAVERVLKGFLLSNGYIIHEHKGVNRLTHISTKSDVYTNLKEEVYSLSEFTKHHVLKAALPWKSEDDLILVMKGLIHLKNLRDQEVHLALGMSIFQIYDILLFKIVNDLFNKAIEVIGTVNNKVDALNNKIDWTNKAFALNGLGRYNEAIEYCNKAIDIDPNLKEAWINKGNAFVGLANYEEAVKCYDSAIQIDPLLKEAWSNKGDVLSKLGEHEEAIKCLDKAIAIDPQYAEAWNNKGYALSNWDKHEEAINFLDKAIEINPILKEAWGNKGRAFISLGRYDDAIKSYNKVIEIDSNDAQALCGMGLALASSKNTMKR